MSLWHTHRKPMSAQKTHVSVSALDKRGYLGNHIIYFSTKIRSGYSLEAPQRGASNESPQRRLLWRNKKNINTFGLKKSALSEGMAYASTQSDQSLFCLLMKSLASIQGLTKNHWLLYKASQKITGFFLYKASQIHFRLNKLPSVLEESNFSLRYVRLCDLDILREKELNYLQTVETHPDQMLHSAASDLGLDCLPVTLLGVSRLEWANYQVLKPEEILEYQDLMAICPRSLKGG